MTNQIGSSQMVPLTPLVGDGIRDRLDAMAQLAPDAQAQLMDYEQQLAMATTDTEVRAVMRAYESRHPLSVEALVLDQAQLLGFNAHRMREVIALARTTGELPAINVEEA